MPQEMDRSEDSFHGKMGTNQNCLSRQEAVHFVREKLGLRNIENAPLDLGTVSEIQRRLMSELPFQNVTMISMPPEKRFPTVDEVIADGLSLRGGACEHNNWFTCLLLRALGFDAYNISAIYCSETDLEDMHMMIIVRGLTDPDDPLLADPLYLIDAASGFPLPQPVPLHRLPVTFPETAGLELSFAKHGDMIYRLHHSRDPNPGEKHPLLDGWKVIMKFNTNPRDPASLKKGMNNTFLADPPTDFLKSLRLFRWPQDKDWAIAFRGSELLFFGENFPVTQSSSHEKMRKYKIMIEDSELERTIIKYFPMICPKQLKETLDKIKEIEQQSKADNSEN